MFRLAGKYFLAKLLFIAWFFVTASPLLLILWLVRYHESVRSTLLWVTAPLGLICLFGSWWLGSATAHYMVDENRMFLESVKRALYDLRLRLAFVPFIGWWFTPDEDTSDYKDDDA